MRSLEQTPSAADDPNKTIKSVLNGTYSAVPLNAFTCFTNTPREDNVLSNRVIQNTTENITVQAHSRQLPILSTEHSPFLSAST